MEFFMDSVRRCIVAKLPSAGGLYQRCGLGVLAAP
jgi:hypothetical protein